MTTEHSPVCRLSVLITCYRFQRRLRAALRNWCQQDLPSGVFEVIVVNPHNDEETHELLASVRDTCPHLRVVEVPVGETIARNKGAMLNAAFRVSVGDWIWLTDADCLFPPNAVTSVLEFVEGRTGYLFYGERRHLDEAQTGAVLAGRLDGVADFAALMHAVEGGPVDCTPWGYTQIVHRSVMERRPYRELTSAQFSAVDNIFMIECGRLGVHPMRIPGLTCLHLHHPFAWYGTDTAL
jgi:glycosyltransferase involved in cell wall biosynthesis